MRVAILYFIEVNPAKLLNPSVVSGTKAQKIGMVVILAFFEKLIVFLCVHFVKGCDFLMQVCMTSNRNDHI